LLILIYEFLIADLLKAIHFQLPPWGHSADSHLSLWTRMKFSEIFVYNFIINPKDSVVILFHRQINTLCSPCCAAFPQEPSCAHLEPLLCSSQPLLCCIPREPSLCSHIVVLTTALLHQQSRPNYDYGVSDFSAGVRTTFIHVILWEERLPNALRDVYGSLLSLHTRSGFYSFDLMNSELFTLLKHLI
jgi:hypothetical protein